MISKKLIVCAVTASFLILPLANSAFAAATKDSDTTGNVTLKDETGGSGASIIVELSPGVALTYSSLATEYAIATANANAKSDYRIEYGIYSGAPGYYQAPNKETDGGTVYDGTLAGDDSSPFSASPWTYMGSGSTDSTGTPAG